MLAAEMTDNAAPRHSGQWKKGQSGKWRDSKGRFVPGNPGLPGRPKGSRNLLADAMIDDLYKDWQEHGIQAIRAARENRPVEYLKVVAVIVSKCGDLSSADDMRDAAVEQFIEERRQQALAMIAKMREPDDA
jgi:hypothetical protein